MQEKKKKEKALQHAENRLKQSQYPFKEYPNPQPEKFQPIPYEMKLPENLREMIIGL